MSYLVQVQAITGYNSHELAAIVGLGESTVRAYTSGRLAEHLDGRQIRALRDAVRLFRDQVIEAVARFEMLA